MRSCPGLPPLPTSPAIQAARAAGLDVSACWAQLHVSAAERVRRLDAIRAALARAEVQPERSAVALLQARQARRASAAP